MKVELGKFLEVMGIPYKDIHLFKEAFTHPSYTNENKGKNYERLEFLGDSVLQYYVSKFIYEKYPNKPEGELTLLRSKLVREESLARFSRELGLGAQIFLGAGEEHNGGRDRNSVLADIFEAFIGAISEDCGIEYVSSRCAPSGRCSAGTGRLRGSPRPAAPPDCRPRRP